MSAATQFVKLTTRAALRGGGGYYRWLAFLLAWIVLGIVAYVHQLRHGLAVTHMTDQVSWGAYIGNFTFLVGTAAAAVMLVIPAYLYRDRVMGPVVVLAELMAIAAVVMCFLFVVVDLGRPERVWHMLPLLGRFHWPQSTFTWDGLVLGSCLLLNAYLSTRLLYARFRGREPNPRTYLPVVCVALVCAIAIHAVTAFWYSRLGGRPFWHAAVLAPQFLASAFAGGPALMIAALMLVRALTPLRVDDGAIGRLRRIAAIAMLINLLLFGTEVFIDRYAGTAQASALRYHLFGTPGHRVLAAATWVGVALNALAVVALLWRRLHRRPRMLVAGCACAVLGVWIEKGLVVPGFVPTPFGEVVHYLPSFAEVCICVGIWAAGALLYTLLVKGAVPVQLGQLHCQEPS